LNTNYSENNHLVLIGKVTSDKKYSHEIYGEKFYVFNLEVVRLSATTDTIPITVSERLLTDVDLSIGKKVKVEGQFRSYNNYENERNRLILTVFAKEIVEATEEESEENDKLSNEVILIGYVCKKPIYRQTPFGREIADILLAVNRAYNKSDYIPSIAWGRNARFCQNIEVGTEVKIIGRVQSRTYEKKFEDGSVETRIAYEVSIASMEIVNKEDGEDSSEENQEEVV
jgi:single-stranded DNA-binding protein